MANTNKNYASLTTKEVATFDFSQVMEDSEKTARWSGDNSECLVHWVGTTPPAIKALKKTVKSHAVEIAGVKNPKSKYITQGSKTDPFTRAKKK